MTQDAINTVTSNEFTELERKILQKVNDFLVSDLNNLNLILQMTHSTYKISPEVLKWFVSIYSKESKSSYIVNNKEFHLYHSYEKKISKYTTKYFNPIRNSCRVIISNDEYNNGYKYEFSIGELNFYKWVIKHQIINYIMNQINDPHEHIGNKKKII